MYLTEEYKKQSCDPRRELQEMSIATFQMGNGKQNVIFPTNTTTVGKKRKSNVNGGIP